MDALIPVTPDTDNTTSNQTLPLRTDTITRISSLGEKEIRSADVIEPVKTTHSSSGGFDVQNVYEAFVAALRDPEDPKSHVGIQEYINGYRELAK